MEDHLLSENVTSVVGVVGEEDRKTRDAIGGIVKVCAFIFFIYTLIYGLSNMNVNQARSFWERIRNDATISDSWFSSVFELIHGNGWKVIIPVLCGCIGIGVVWLGLLIYFTFPVLVLFMASCVAAFAALTFVFARWYIQTQYSWRYYLTSAICSGVATLVLLCLCAFFWRRLKFTAKMISHGCRALLASRRIFLFGTVVLVYLILFIAAWIVTIASLILCGQSTVVLSTGKVAWALPSNVQAYIVFAVLFGIWHFAFVAAVIRTVVSGSVASWYFAPDKSRIKHSSFFFLYISLTYSIGSLAWGSLIVTLATIVQWMAQFSVANTKERNILIRAAAWMVSCLVACFAWIVKYVSRYGFILVAIQGESFCSSCKKAWQLMSRGSDSFLFTDIITGYLMVFMKLTGCALALIISVVVMDSSSDSVYHLDLQLGVLIFALVYVVLSVFSTAVHIATDAVLVCYLEDKKNSDPDSLSASNDLQETIASAPSKK